MLLMLEHYVTQTIGQYSNTYYLIAEYTSAQGLSTKILVHSSFNIQSISSQFQHLFWLILHHHIHMNHQPNNQQTSWTKKCSHKVILVKVQPVHKATMFGNNQSPPAKKPWSSKSPEGQFLRKLVKSMEIMTLVMQNWKQDILLLRNLTQQHWTVCCRQHIRLLSGMQWLSQMPLWDVSLKSAFFAMKTIF